MIKYTKATAARISSTMKTALKKESIPIAIPDDPLAPLLSQSTLNNTLNIILS